MSPATTVQMSPGHIGLNVTDIDRSIAFYQEVFGFELSGRGGEGIKAYALLGYGDQLVVTLWQQAAKDFGPDTAGLHHLAFAVESLEDVRAAEVRVRGTGAELAYDGIAVDMEGADSGGIFFFDPDGARLEIRTGRGVAGHPAPTADGPTCGFF